MLPAANRSVTRPELKRVLLESLAVCALGAALGLAANYLSPRGLSLSRNYFPQATRPAPATAALPSPDLRSLGESNVAVAANPAAAPGPRESVSTAHARLAEKGLAPIETREALRLFRDPEYDQELIIFVDARDDRHYQQGHVPGAYQFDRYRPERYLPEVMPACLNAKQVVVYCAGGDCEDSEFAALALRDAGVPAERLLVYAAGFNAWVADKLPVETGDRRSGTLKGGTE